MLDQKYLLTTLLSQGLWLLRLSTRGNGGDYHVGRIQYEVCHLRETHPVRFCGSGGQLDGR